MMFAVIGAIGLIWRELVTTHVVTDILILRSKQMIMTKIKHLEICG
jgi:hypothetical protein